MERALTRAFDRFVRRARVIAAAEASGWGAALAAVSVALGAAAAIAIGAWRAGRLTREAIVRRVDRGGGASNLLVTADELLRGVLKSGADVRARVLRDASDRLMPADVARAIPSTAARRAALAAILCWTVAGAWSVARNGERGRAPASGSATAIASSARWHLVATIEPPPYTGLPHATVDDPTELRVVEGSTIELKASSPIRIERDGAASPARFVATRSGVVSVHAERDRTAVIAIVVVPDALPNVRVTVPGRDLVLADASTRVSFEAHATDDYGLRSLTLQYTKVSGSGEQYSFEGGEIPLALARPSPREWSGVASSALAALGLKDGDMLVYRAVASDAKPGTRDASSDAYFVEISKLGVAAGDAFTLPEQETRYALSEQMLIVKTERLNRARATMTVADATEASLNLAVEQRAIRAEFVFMLGGEVEDEEVEAERSIELQAGRLANRGQRDLRDATRAMSQAEQLLTGGDPRAALGAERAAVEALQRAFARDRYLLRALASRAQLDPARRLTGDRTGARETRVARPNTSENRRAARLQDLLAGVGALARDASAGQTIDRGRTAVLAETALRADPDSATLRAVAGDIQRGAFDRAAAAVAAEARRAFADPSPSFSTVAPTLQRALDAARSARP